MISFRLSEDEHERIERLCPGQTSLALFAREVLLRHTANPQSGSAANYLPLIDKSLRELSETLELLSTGILRTLEHSDSDRQKLVSSVADQA